MFDDKLILMFSGILESVAEQKKLYNIAKAIDPELPTMLFPDHRFLTTHFRSKNRLYDWITAVLNKTTSKKITGIRNFLKEMEKQGLYYNHTEKRIELTDETKRKEAGWGLLVEGDKYYASILRAEFESHEKPSKDLSSSFKNYALNHITNLGGRIWSFNDNVITAGFFTGEKEAACFNGAIDMLLNFIFFNLSSEELTKTLSLKICATSDFITYNNKTENIYGPAVGMLDILKEYSDFNTIIINEKALERLGEHCINFFTPFDAIGDEKIFKFTYQIG
jgi:hypothetical protein